ncbi:class I SAM-dependent methyltransferase [Nocardia sp. NBC_00508]|uniref:class I SAM-dependent methyltransferase n=1 Tax=Nocardia sp. NBC_00508 TaxID=2975992 RepID=UPI002E812666|nr:class I SAM-dependent methyltransferase [Nocardia sp. NBC_00508]WUD69343.1 class I SAM-dependent methyltransferase [Nocardia sp. NBC_00508]
MTGNEPKSAIAPQDDDIGVLLTQPRRYRAFKAAFLLGRGGRLNVRLAELARPASGARVVDIGCGPGDFARMLARRGGQVTGVDPSPQMIDYATARSRDLTHCRFELGTAQSLPLPDASADLVTSTFAMHHIPAAHRSDAVAQMFRVLRPGGRLLLADTHPTGPVLSTAVRVMARFAAHRTHDTAHDNGDHLASIDIRRYRDVLRASGFEDVQFVAVRPATGVLLATKP